MFYVQNVYMTNTSPMQKYTNCIHHKAHIGNTDTMEKVYKMYTKCIDHKAHSGNTGAIQKVYKNIYFLYTI